MNPVNAPLRVFVVEDDADTRRALAMYVQHLGHRVTCATSLQEALEGLAVASYDAIIADIGLGDGSGWDLLPQLRARGIPCPPYAVAMSGFGMSEDQQRSRNAGFADHLLKPFDPKRLKALLQDAMAVRDASSRPGEAG